MIRQLGALLHWPDKSDQPVSKCNYREVWLHICPEVDVRKKQFSVAWRQFVSVIEHVHPLITWNEYMEWDLITRHF
jgi:hypothetical protein